MSIQSCPRATEVVSLKETAGVCGTPGISWDECPSQRPLRNLVPLIPWSTLMLMDLIRPLLWLQTGG